MTYHNEIDPVLLCSIHDLLVLASGTVIDCYSRGATSQGAAPKRAEVGPPRCGRSCDLRPALGGLASRRPAHYHFTVKGSQPTLPQDSAQRGMAWIYRKYNRDRSLLAINVEAFGVDPPYNSAVPVAVLLVDLHPLTVHEIG
jgi:hypothetical protein